ncbi:MAG TPA: rhamnulokinase family protein [Tepidisphaeraceae bacterium]|nr:rhamnulokinase family protein [Tepidisphaeraceae bacterium]
MKHYIAFDFGAESGRAILGSLDGRKLTIAEKHRFANPNGRMQGTLQWDLLAQWEQIKQGLKLAAEGADRIAGIGVDTWGVDFGLIDAAGKGLGHPVMYRDGRTDTAMDEVFRIVPADEVFAATGNQFMQFNTLFQLWALKRDNPRLLDAADRLLFMPDLFHYLLTGLAANEFSIASTSQMYDPQRRTWSGELLNKLDLPARLLGKIVPSGTVLGALKDDVAREVGVKAMPVITPASHDTGSAVASVPAEGGSWCYISSGTWSLMGVELPEPLINEKSRKYNYTNEGGAGGSIRFLKNIMGMWLVQECRRAFKAAGHDHTYAELTQMAERAEGFRSLVDPDYPPMLKPGDMPGKIDEYCNRTNQPRPTSRGEYVRACIDSLALTYRRTLEGLEDILGKRIDTIHIVGGGTQNELLNQLTADICGRTVIAGPIEATAIGNILVQAMATGQIGSLSEARAVVRASFPVKRYDPDEDAVSACERAYQRFRALQT